MEQENQIIPCKIIFANDALIKQIQQPILLQSTVAQGKEELLRFFSCFIPAEGKL